MGVGEADVVDVDVDETVEESEVVDVLVIVKRACLYLSKRLSPWRWTKKASRWTYS